MEGGRDKGGDRREEVEKKWKEGEFVEEEKKNGRMKKAIHRSTKELAKVHVRVGDGVESWG